MTDITFHDAEAAARLADVRAELVEHFRAAWEWEAVPCVMCGPKQASSLLVVKDGIDVRRCEACGHVFVSPRLPEAAVGELYGNAYWDIYSQAIGSPSLRDRVRFDYENGFGKLRRDILPFRQRGRLLDVGASNGGLVRAARESGFSAEGLEPSAEICELSRDLQGVDLYCGDIRDGHFTPESFDIITMHDVLEHVFEPFEVLVACRKVLAPRGIVVVETPTTDALDAVKDFEEWECMSPLEHVHLFSEANLAELFHRADLK
ncbi:MAG TPA: class I SAM-dependent methyltransferase, partial [Acidimicrobiales bacterium]|nr:class I SAM-dependent methyltransferase [Acidimicrobiales bacterium]